MILQLGFGAQSHFQKLSTWSKRLTAAECVALQILFKQNRIENMAKLIIDQQTAHMVFAILYQVSYSAMLTLKEVPQLFGFGMFYWRETAESAEDPGLHSPTVVPTKL